MARPGVLTARTTKQTESNVLRNKLSVADCINRRAIQDNPIKVEFRFL